MLISEKWQRQPTIKKPLHLFAEASFFLDKFGDQVLVVFLLST